MGLPVYSAASPDDSPCNCIGFEDSQMTRYTNHQHSISPPLNEPNTCSIRLENGSFCPGIATCAPTMTRCSMHDPSAVSDHAAGLPVVYDESEIQAQLLGSVSDDDASESGSEASTVVLERTSPPVKAPVPTRWSCKETAGLAVVLCVVALLIAACFSEVFALGATPLTGRNTWSDL